MRKKFKKINPGGIHEHRLFFKNALSETIILTQKHLTRGGYLKTLKMRHSRVSVDFAPGSADQFMVNKDFWNIALERPNPFILV